jgi:hypothetical protein
MLRGEESRDGLLIAIRLFGVLMRFARRAAGNRG